MGQTMISEAEFAQAVATLQTPRDCLRWAETSMRRHGVFLGHGTDDYWDEGLSLMLHVLSLPWDSDPRLLDARLLPLEVEQFAGLLRRRVNDRVPAAYLTGKAWFGGFEFNVDQRVLIPRSPIAELIEQRFEPWLEPEKVSRVLDMCTGSGCIAIACAAAFPTALVDASDISRDALDVCRENIEKYGLEQQVRALCGDGLGAVEGRYDLIVSNPPYVDATDMASLPAEYRHEPSLALASGDDGLDFTRKLLAGAAEHLTPEGILVVEVGNSQATVELNWPEVPFTWLDFERGGQGVFLLTRAQLEQYRHLL
jgi:ribosomal protein L3 glutamine methyltransferase